MVALVKTSAWGGLHGSLALVHNNSNYTTITKGTVTSTALVAQPDAVNKKITATLTPLEILTLQEETKTLLREFDLQEAVTNIGVQQIVNSIEKQYIKDSMKSTSGTPITPSMVSFIISKPTGVRS